MLVNKHDPLSEECQTDADILQTLVLALPERRLPPALRQVAPGGLQKPPAVAAVRLLAEPLAPPVVYAFDITDG